MEQERAPPLLSEEWRGARTKEYMADKRSYREVLGQRLRDFREKRGLTAYKVAKDGGIRIEQVRAVESGETNYTVDALLGYVMGCGLYMYFAEKTDGRELPHDFGDIARKAVENDPWQREDNGRECP